MTQLSIKRLASGGVITNYHCVSRCGHCLYNCSPRRAKDFLGEEKAGRIFRLIAALGCRAVHIGGGEPLLAPQKLTAVLVAARRAGVAIDYIETNSAWFADPDQADHILNQLSDAGVGTLLVSISPFHNAHIPFARVKGVIDACRRSGIRVFPWVNDFVRELNRLDDHETHPMETFETLFGPDYLHRIPDRYWIHLGGRALHTFRRVCPQMPVGQILDRAPMSCARALGDTSHFHIDLYGNYIPGLCAGLAVAMEDLGRPLREGKYPLLDRLAADGIRGLHQLAVRRFGYTPQQASFLNACDLCTDIRCFLLGLEKEKLPELAPAGFYDEWQC